MSAAERPAGTSLLDSKSNRTTHQTNSQYGLRTQTKGSGKCCPRTPAKGSGRPTALMSPDA
ncbi:MAG: hypothetical protein ABI699_19850, partial [Caldimonas sp.]